MNQPHDPKSDAWLESVVQAFDAQTPPPRPGDQTLLEKLRETDSAESSDSLSHRDGFSFMRYWNMKTRRFLIAAAVIIVACVLTGILLPERFNPQQALAQMVQNVQSIKTVAFSIAMSMGGQSVTGEIKINNEGKMRQEMTVMGNKVANVIDFAKGKTLTLDASQKVAVEMNLGQLPETRRPTNVIDEFRKMPHEDTKLVEEIQQDGKTLLVYETNQMPKASVKVWVDKQTLLPVRMVMTMPDLLKEGTSSMEFSNFRWDAPVDASDFSMTIPEGYKLQTMDMDLSNVTEQDFVLLLKMWAMLSGGSFPDEMTPMNMATSFAKISQEAANRTPEQKKELAIRAAREVFGMEIAGDVDDEQFKKLEEQLHGRVIKGMARGSVFLSQMIAKKQDFHWVGKGARKGIAGRIICYWTESEGKYKAIDAAFNVITLTADQLPKE